MQSHPKVLNARALLSRIRARVARPAMVHHYFDSALATGCDTGLYCGRTGRLQWICCGGCYGPRAAVLSHSSGGSRVHLWERSCHALSKSLVGLFTSSSWNLSGRNNGRNGARTRSRLSRQEFAVTPMPCGSNYVALLQHNSTFTTLRMEVGLQLVGKLTQSLTHFGGSLGRPTHLSSLHFCPISTVHASGRGHYLDRISPFAYPRYRFFRGRVGASVQWVAACYETHSGDFTRNWRVLDDSQVTKNKSLQLKNFLISLTGIAKRTQIHRHLGPRPRDGLPDCNLMRPFRPILLVVYLSRKYDKVFQSQCVPPPCLSRD